MLSDKALAVDAYICESIEVSQSGKPAPFLRDGGPISLVVKLKTDKSKDEIPVDLTFAYDKGRSPSNWYINDKVVSVGEVADGNKITLTIKQEYLESNQGDQNFEAGIFSKTDCVSGDWFSCRDSIKQTSGEECIVKIVVYNIPPGSDTPMPGSCATATNQALTDRFSCYRTYSSTTGNVDWFHIRDTETDYDNKCLSSRGDLDKMAWSCNSGLEKYGSQDAWCVLCPDKRSDKPIAGITYVNTAGSSCNNTNLQCLKDVLECKTINIDSSAYGVPSTKSVCVYNEGTGQLGNYCLVGSKECGKGLTCFGEKTSEQLENYKINSEGKCINFDGGDNDIYKQVCDSKVPSSCNIYLKQLTGYKFARCMNSGFCRFDVDPAGEVAKLNDGGELQPSPVIPVPPSRFIERCKGDLSCANCVARKVLTPAKPDASPPEKATYQPFSTYADAAATEYTYNQEVDKWKQGQLDDGDYTQAPTPTEFAYTGYIYTSLGCLDTTDNGLITRVVQIALGVIGSVILVRFAQAALKLQGGSSPEDKAEGIEIVTSAIVALLLFVMSMIVLRFIGVDLFQIFSPGSFEIG